ncbi:MAG TPA: NAD(P)H nitroreductase [Mycobacteriales bacterium]
MTETSTAPTRADFERAVGFAVLAPSIHNTQPWRWVAHDGVLDLYADADRRLPAVDPDGRGMLVSCGGALWLAVLGFAVAGWETAVERMPDPDRPDLLARVRATGARRPTAETVELARAAERRHTERRPFDPAPVPAPLLDRLAEVAAGEGVYASIVTSPDVRLDLAVAFSWSDRVEAEDPAYRAELARWSRRADSGSRDGIPAEAVPHVPAGAPRHTDVPIRDFEAGITGGQTLPEPADEQPAMLVLFTTGDGDVDRLRAGEAYVRMSVEAERLGLASSALTQAIDLPAVRERFRTLMDWPDHPQMVLRVGRPPAGEPAPPVPRRQISAVLTVE